MSEGRDKETVTSGPQAMRLIPLWMELAFILEKQNRKSLAKKKIKLFCGLKHHLKLIRAAHKRNHLLQEH